MLSNSGPENVLLQVLVGTVPEIGITRVLARRVSVLPEGSEPPSSRKRTKFAGPIRNPQRVVITKAPVAASTSVPPAGRGIKD